MVMILAKQRRRWKEGKWQLVCFFCQFFHMLVCGEISQANSACWRVIQSSILQENNVGGSTSKKWWWLPGKITGNHFSEVLCHHWDVIIIVILNLKASSITLSKSLHFKLKQFFITYLSFNLIFWRQNLPFSGFCSFDKGLALSTKNILSLKR